MKWRVGPFTFTVLSHVFLLSSSELEISAKAVRIVVIGYLIPQFLISGKQSSWPLENAMASAKI